MLSAPSAPLSRAERTSLALSSSAFVLAACALAVARGGGGGNFAALAAERYRESPPQRYREPTAPGSISVELGRLSIGASNLAPGAVTAAAIADGAITDRALADGSISLAKLSVEAAAATGSIVGEVNELGAVIHGSGFSARRVAAGDYELRFNVPFQARPIVLAVAQQYGVCYLPQSSIELSRVRIKCMSDLLGSAPDWTDTRFSFIATAPAE